MLKRFFAMKEDNLDEREIQLRGIIFRNGFFLTLIMVLVNIYLQQRGILWRSPYYANSITVLGAAIFVMCAHLWQGIYPISLFAQKLFAALFALMGLGAVCSCVYSLIKGAPLFTGFAFSNTGITLIMGILLLLPGLVLVAFRRKWRGME